jgi:septal ring factor EnvC (AmiA/AmiB activator)
MGGAGYSGGAENFGRVAVLTLLGGSDMVGIGQTLSRLSAWFSGRNNDMGNSLSDAIDRLEDRMKDRFNRIDREFRGVTSELSEIRQAVQQVKEILMVTKAEVNAKLDEQLAGVTEQTTLLAGIDQWGKNLEAQLEELKANADLDEDTVAKLDSIGAGIRRSNDVMRALAQNTGLPADGTVPTDTGTQAPATDPNAPTDPNAGGPAVGPGAGVS